MKRVFSLLALIIFILVGYNSYSQEKFTTYDNLYISKTFDIKISSKVNDKFDLYIDAMSLDKLHDKGGITIDEKQHHDFVIALLVAKIKYEEWVKTAKDNNVRELEKTMPFNTKVGGYFLYGNSWNFQNLVNLDFDFKILEHKDKLAYLLIIRTGELQSSSNQFMKADGFVLAFTSADAIAKFSNSISLKKINEFINKPEAKDLFK